MKENILITGGAGLLALNWGLALRDDYNVYLVMHSRKIQLPGTTSTYFSLDSLEEIQMNIEKIKPKVVIHAAGLTSVEMCETNPEFAHHTNVTLAENIAKVCSKLNISLVHISTDHLFSGNEQLVKEEHPTEPQNVYAKTKAEAELRVLNSYPESLVVRTNFYGWGTTYRTSFSDMIINSLKKGKSLTLFHDVFYTPIYTGVLIQAVHDLVKVKTTGIYHVVGDEKLSKYQFGKKIAKQFGLDDSLIDKGSFADQPNLIHRPYDMSISNEKVCELLGRTLGNVDEHIHMLYQQYETGLAQEIQKL
ncbi:MAG: SDR family oxidoreductase [Pseudomonadota bacterium]